jgi:malate dehydrogenase (oxaloacetate-decarboxylating)
VPWAANNTERHNPGDRFADDPAFAVHEGGKLKVCPTRPIRSIDDLALTYLSLTGLSASREH